MSHSRLFSHMYMKGLCLALGVMCLLGPQTARSAAPEAGQVRSMQQSVRHAVQTEAGAQAKVQSWQEEADGLINEARTLNLELQWYELHEKKLERYVAAQEAKIAEMELARQRYALMSVELEAQLVSHVQTLEDSIKAGPPFLREERDRRIVFLRESLNEPGLGVGEKLRRLLEGLNAEADYSLRLESGTQNAVFDGRSMDLAVLRAGRVAYYCLTPDRRKAGIWDQKGNGFVPLPESALPRLVELEQNAAQKRFVSLPLAPAFPRYSAQGEE